MDTAAQLRGLELRDEPDVCAADRRRKPAAAKPERGRVAAGKPVGCGAGSAALGELELACYRRLKKRIDAAPEAARGMLAAAFLVMFFGASLVGVKLAP